MPEVPHPAAVAIENATLEEVANREVDERAQVARQFVVRRSDFFAGELLINIAQELARAAEKAEFVVRSTNTLNTFSLIQNNISGGNFFPPPKAKVLLRITFDPPFKKSPILYQILILPVN